VFKKNIYISTLFSNKTLMVWFARSPQSEGGVCGLTWAGRKSPTGRWPLDRDCTKSLTWGRNGLVTDPGRHVTTVSLLTQIFRGQNRKDDKVLLWYRKEKVPEECLHQPIWSLFQVKYSTTSRTSSHQMGVVDSYL